MGVATAGREVAAIETPAFSHRGRLAEHAGLLQRWLARPERSPARWRSAQFGRLVELVRAHLRPISTPELLAQSYTREHFHVVCVDRSPAGAALLKQDAAEVAYALRWSELVEGTTFAAWPALVGSVGKG